MNYVSPPSTLPPGSRVFCYLRDSGGNSQEESTAQQRRVVDEYCQRFGLILVRVFEDAARRGGTTKNRTRFMEMIDAAQSFDRPDGVLIWNFARFARDVDISSYYKSMLRLQGLIVHSLTDKVPDGEFSRVVEFLIDFANEEKTKQTSKDVKRGLAQKVEGGYRSGGKPAVGYLAIREIAGTKRDGSPRYGAKMEPDPELGPLVTLAFRMRADGRSLAEIMDATHGRLYKTKGCFTSMFTNKTYLGVGLCGGLEIEDHHPALVDLDTWNAVQVVRENAKKNMQGNLLHPRRVNSPSLLAGMAVCIHCGTPVNREVSGKAKWQAYLCGRKRNRANWHACEGKQINAAKADKAVLDAVLGRILTPEYFYELLEEVRNQLSDTSEVDQQEERARQALAECKKAIGRLLDAIEKSDSPSALDRLKERENERARLQFELAALQAKREAARLEISPDALMMVLQVWAGEIEQARDDNDIRAMQVLLRRFVTKIELGYNVAKIWYTYPVDALVDFTNKERASLGAHFSYRVITKALFLSWS